MSHGECSPNDVSHNNHTAATILAGIVRSLVCSPDDVKVDVQAAEESVLLSVRVNPNDVETIFGAGGRTARSLRTVIAALGKRSGQRFTLDIQS